MTKKILLATIFSLSILISGCAKWVDQGESITAVGSSALQPLVESVAEEFQSNNPGKFINVQGGGSGTGLSQVQAGAVEIGNSDLFAEEKSGIDATKLEDHRVAVVGITPIVNPKVGIKNISLANLQKVFSGEITNWKELGGTDTPIVLLNRASGSGTRATFEKWVMDGQEAKQAQEQDSSGMVRQIVKDTAGAISYVAFSYVTSDVQTLSIDGAKPTDENVMDNKWIIWSYEHMYTKGEPDAGVKKFLDYMTSDEVQNGAVKELGYLPITSMKVERSADGTVTDVK